MNSQQFIKIRFFKKRYKIIYPLTTNRSWAVQRESRAFTHRSTCFPCSLVFVIANPAPHILATQSGLFKRTTHKVLIYEGSSMFLGWSLTKDYIVNPVEMPACRGEVLSFSTRHFQLYSVNRTNWGGEGLGSSELALSKIQVAKISLDSILFECRENWSN